MAWETRHSSARYYYRKRRANGRVVSEYIGTGPVAELCELVDQNARKQAREIRQELMSLMRQDEEIDEILDISIDMARMALVLAGCHTHKGEWRLKRG
jgi:hypothetical protein